MKKLLSLFLVLIILFNFTGCCGTTVPKEDESQEATSIFIELEAFGISNGGCACVFYHKDTKVMYIVSYEGVATVMLNPDGTPQTYSK